MSGATLAPIPPTAPFVGPVPSASPAQQCTPTKPQLQSSQPALKQEFGEMEIKRVIGKGTFGMVVQAVPTESGIDCVHEGMTSQIHPPVKGLRPRSSRCSAPNEK